MPRTALTSSPRPGGILLRAVIFLAIFSLVLLAAIRLYLVPAMTALKTADEAQRRHLQATAILMLCVVLFVLFAGLLLTFRPGRFFFPRAPAARAKPTVYTDAWAEAGRRASAASGDNDDDESERS